MSSVISKGLLIDKLCFDGLIMKKHEWVGDPPEIVLILVTRRPVLATWLIHPDL